MHSSTLPGHDYLNSQWLWDGKREFGLDVPTQLFAEFDNPQDKLKTIHVAGTNGKGSVCSMLSAILFKAGNKVGQFTSPHLSEVRERCVINGQPVDAQSFDKQLVRVQKAAEKLKLNPSYFEVATVATFLEFVDAKVDWAVIEVGLGGRLDATNVITKPEASVITSIGLDHTHILGDTLAKIAGEKAGIIKNEVPVFIGLMSDEAREVIVNKANHERCEIYLIQEKDLSSSPETNFAGSFQKRNAALAALVASKLGFSDEIIGQGILLARWPGRLELVDYQERCVKTLFDCAHNPDGLKELKEHLMQSFASKEYSFKRVVFMISMLETKAWQEMLITYREIVKELFDKFNIPCRIVFTQSGNKMSLPPARLKQEARMGEAVVNLREALAESSKGGEGTLMIVSGSIYLVGKVRPAVMGNDFRTIDVCLVD